MTTLHLKPPIDPPGVDRSRCAKCGVMLINRPDSFWKTNTFTEQLDHYRHWPDGSANLPGEMQPCTK